MINPRQASFKERTILLLTKISLRVKLWISNDQCGCTGVGYGRKADAWRIGVQLVVVKRTLLQRSLGFRSPTRSILKKSVWMFIWRDWMGRLNSNAGYECGSLKLIGKRLWSWEGFRAGGKRRQRIETSWMVCSSAWADLRWNSGSWWWWEAWWLQFMQSHQKAV